MKLLKNFTIRKLISNICVLLALIAFGSNGFQLRDSGKSVQSADSLLKQTVNFLEKENKKKKEKKNGSTKPTKIEPKPVKKTFKKREESESNTKVINTVQAPPIAAFKAPYKNDTLSRSSWRDINNTMVVQSPNEFVQNHRKWDFKLLDHELQEIAEQMNYREQYGHSSQGIRSFIRFFINYFEACDTDGDNILSKLEFRVCMKNDTFLNIIDAPTALYAALTVLL
jgi:hypothetical protein